MRLCKDRKNALLLKCNLRIFIGLTIMGYEPLYQALQNNYAKRTHDFLGRFYCHFGVAFYSLGAILTTQLFNSHLLDYEMITGIAISLAIYQLISNAHLQGCCSGEIHQLKKR